MLGIVPLCLISFIYLCAAAGFAKQKNWPYAGICFAWSVGNLLFAYSAWKEHR